MDAHHMRPQAPRDYPSTTLFSCAYFARFTPLTSFHFLLIYVAQLTNVSSLLNFFECC